MNKKLNENPEFQQCMSYFNSSPVYARLFSEMAKKYARLGHFGGRITLKELKTEERAALGGFVGKDYSQQQVTVSVALLETALKNSRFGQFTWTQILEAYQGKPLQISKVCREQEKNQRETWFSGILNDLAQTPAGQWLTQVLNEKSDGYRLLMQQYDSGKEQLAMHLKNLKTAGCRLPVFTKELCRLPVFAAQITGNPHYYDPGNMGERLLMLMLKFMFRDEKEQGLSGPEERKRLLFLAGLLTDDLSNHTLAYGLLGMGNNGEMHPGMAGFYEMKEPVWLTLLTLGKLSSVIPGKLPVYVVENPAVFSAMIQKNPDICAICGSGQLCLSTLVLMDLICKYVKKSGACQDHWSGPVFYYAGDFDPEGLLIAQRLLNRYGSDVALWKYEPSYYEGFLSDTMLDDRRIKMLERIECPQLEPVCRLMGQYKKAVYQESILDAYLEDLNPEV